jgi:hypothetical protein
MARRVSFYRRPKVRKEVSFKARGRRVSFKARLPSERREKVTFYTTRKRKK